MVVAWVLCVFLNSYGVLANAGFGVEASREVLGLGSASWSIDAVPPPTNLDLQIRPVLKDGSFHFGTP